MALECTWPEVPFTAPTQKATAWFMSPLHIEYN